MFTILNILTSLEQWITPMHRYAFIYRENGRFVRLHSCWVTNVTGARRFSLPIGDSVCSKWWWSDADAFLIMQWDTHLLIIADRYFVHPTDETRVAKSKQIFQAKKLQKTLESAWIRPVIQTIKPFILEILADLGRQVNYFAARRDQNPLDLAENLLNWQPVLPHSHEKKQNLPL